MNGQGPRFFRRPGSPLFLYLLLLCALLILSMAASYLILLWLAGDPPTAPSPVSYREAAPAYRVLAQFRPAPDRIPDPQTDLEHRLPEIRLAARLRLAAAALLDKDLPRASALLASVPAGSLLTGRHNRLERQLLFQEGQFEILEQRLGEVATPGETERAMAIIASWKLGRISEAAQLFRRWFASGSLELAMRTLPAGLINQWCQDFPSSFWPERFDRLLERGALGQLVRELPLARDPQLTLLYGAELHYRRKAYDPALSLLARIADGVWTPRRERLRIKIDLRRGSFQEVIARVNALRRWPDLYAELLSDSAAILLGRGEYDLALHFLERYRDTCPFQQELRWKTEWSIAWLLMRQGRTDPALQAFNRGTASPFSHYRVPSLYWQARLLHQPAAIADYPFSYYSSRVPATTGGPRQPVLFLSALAGSLDPRRQEPLDRVRTLWQQGYVDEALEAIRHLREPFAQDSLDWRMSVLVEALIQHGSGRYQAAFLLVRKVFPDIMSLRLPPAFDFLLFPVAFRPQIEASCREERLDPARVMGLIREETFFRADAVSPVGAVGLMQVMPATGRRIGAMTGIDRAQERLTDPAISTRLGCRYLRWLLDRYDGRVYCALAAYNAGEGRVDEWLTRMPEVPEEEFIEMIPFTETRNYVKNILRNRPFYRSILDRGAPKRRS